MSHDNKTDFIMEIWEQGLQKTPEVYEVDQDF